MNATPANSSPFPAAESPDRNPYAPPQGRAEAAVDYQRPLRVGWLAQLVGFLTAAGACMFLGPFFPPLLGFEAAWVCGALFGGLVMYKLAATGPPVNSFERTRLIGRTLGASLVLFVVVPLSFWFVIFLIGFGALPFR